MSENLININWKELLEDKDFKIDKSILVAPKSTSVSRDITRAGIITIIKSLKHGKRLILSNELRNYFNDPDSLQFSFLEDILIISEHISDDFNTFKVRKGNRAIIYAGQLVDEIAEVYELDFSNRVSITFHDVVYNTIDERPAAFIKIKE